MHPRCHRRHSGEQAGARRLHVGTRESARDAGASSWSASRPAASRCSPSNRPLERSIAYATGSNSRSPWATARSGSGRRWMRPSRARVTRDAGCTNGAKYDKAVACLIKDREALLAFFDLPAEHWYHLRTANPIKSVFATVRHRNCSDQGRALAEDSEADGLRPPSAPHRRNGAG
jgi:hypothetical protein